MTPPTSVSPTDASTPSLSSRDRRSGRRLRTAARRTLVAGVLAAVAAAGAVTVPQHLVPTLPQADAAAVCSEAAGGTKFYPGDNSSKVYNTTFAQSRSTNHYLQNYVPQGLGVWTNWNGHGEDLFLIGMHHRDENSHLSLIYGITTTGGTFRGAAYLPKGAHAGGVKTYKKWLYVQQNTSAIRKYSLASVAKSFRSAGVQGLGGGSVQRVSNVSFFDVDNGYLYAGLFNKDKRSSMKRYRIDAAGQLRNNSWGPVQVPKKSQGVLVLRDTFIFSTSWDRNNHSNIYVIRRGYATNFESVRYRCFEGPVLSEELVGYRGRTYLLFEGGAAEFAGHYPWTTADNKIKNLHSASTATLRGMVW